MAEENHSRRTGKYLGSLGLAALVLGLTLTAGCATPNCIKHRRYLGSINKLNSGSTLDLTANDRDVAVRSGISIDFNTIKDIKKEAAGACAAYFYGFFRPAYSEFWHSSNPEKFEYSGLAPFDSDGYKPGMGYQTAGEWSRYLAIAGGIIKATQKKGGHHDAAPETEPARTTYTGGSDKKTDEGEKKDEGGDVTPPQPRPISGGDGDEGSTGD